MLDQLKHFSEKFEDERGFCPLILGIIYKVSFPRSKGWEIYYMSSGQIAQVHKRHLLPELVESLGEPVTMTEEHELRFAGNSLIG